MTKTPVNLPALREARCHWEGCMAKAIHSQRDNDGNVWSLLCEEHHKELDDALGALDVKATMRAWVKAQGGAKAAAARRGGFYAEK